MVDALNGDASLIIIFARWKTQCLPVEWSDSDGAKVPLEKFLWRLQYF